MGPRRHDLVGVGDKSGRYYILKRDRDQGPATEDVEVLATLELDPGGSLGAILSTAAYDAGVLYIASHAKIVEGKREAGEISDILSLPAPPAADFSTKIVALEVRKLLEGDPADEYTRGQSKKILMSWKDRRKYPALPPRPLPSPMECSITPPLRGISGGWMPPRVSSYSDGRRWSLSGRTWAALWPCRFLPV